MDVIDTSANKADGLPWFERMASFLPESEANNIGKRMPQNVFVKRYIKVYFNEMLESLAMSNWYTSKHSEVETRQGSRIEGKD